MVDERYWVLVIWNDNSPALLGKDADPAKPMTWDRAKLLALQVRNSAVRGALRVFLVAPNFSAEPPSNPVWRNDAFRLEEIA